MSGASHRHLLGWLILIDRLNFLGFLSNSSLGGSDFLATSSTLGGHLLRLNIGRGTDLLAAGSTLLGLRGLDGDLSGSIGTFVRNFLGGTATLLGLDPDIGLSRSNLFLGSLLGGTATLLALLGLSLGDGRLRDGIILISFLSTSLLLLGGLLVSILGITQAMLLGRRGLLVIVIGL